MSLNKNVNVINRAKFCILVSPNLSLSSCSGLNTSMTVSPGNVLNMSDQFKFLMPQKSVSKKRFSWSPMVNDVKSPNLSPIVKCKESPSNFLKRRDPK